MIRRRIVLVYWVAAISLFTPGAAYAYIDPATTTYLIQIATALVVTIGVSLSIFLYRFRMISSKIKYLFYGVLYRLKTKEREKSGGLDKGAAAEPKPYIPPVFSIPGAGTPPEIESFSEDIRESLTADRAAIASGKPGGDGTAPRTYTGKMRLTIPLALAFCFSFIVVGCLELAIQYAPEIPFRISVIAPVVLICFAALSALLILIVPGLKGQAFEILLVLGLAVLSAGYIQGNFLNKGIGELSGDTIIWGDLVPQFIASMICWAGCFVLVILIWKRARKAWRLALLVVPFLVILLQGVGFLSVIYNYSDGNMLSEKGKWASAGDFWRTADEALTTDRINEVSPDRNAIVIVLDRLDQEFIEEIAAEDPRFFDPLDGFTKFDDFITNYASTFPSVASYLTGHRYEYDVPRSEYYDYAWSNALFFRTLRDRGVDIRLYIERGQAYSDINQLGGLASNTFEGELGINKRIALVKLLKLSGYRFAPMPMKQLFWFSPTEFIDTLELTDKTAPYITDDFRYYAELSENGLYVSEEYRKSLIYIHLQGSHPPYRMDENIQYIQKSTYIQQTKGAFKIVYEYLDQLRALGLYEDATIVIMGDHGNYLGRELTRPAHTGLMVKPAGSAGTPPRISHAPVSPDQLHATLMEGLFGDSQGFGDTFFDINEGDDVIREYDVTFWRYIIKGDGRDFSNWYFLGEFPRDYY